MLKEVHLHEISVVAVPAAPRAQVTTIKALADVRHVLKAMRDVESNELDELREIRRELKRLLIGNDPDEQRAETLAYLRAFATDLQRIAR